MKQLIAGLAAFVALATTPAVAQEQQPSRRFQIAPFVGAFIPTGEQRDLVDDAPLAGLTVSYEVEPHVAIVGSFGWAGSEGTAPALADDVDVFQYDLGIQGGYAFDLGKGLALKPFVGAGFGARTYHLRHLDLEDETDFAGYLGAGADLLFRNLALGVTVRDYVTYCDGIGARMDAEARNDIALFTSLGVRF